MARPPRPAPLIDSSADVIQSPAYAIRALLRIEYAERQFQALGINSFWERKSATCARKSTAWTLKSRAPLLRVVTLSMDTGLRSPIRRISRRYYGM